MSSIFSQTIAKAISEYRAMLRRYLPQSERMIRLARLNLKDPKIYENEVALFQAAHSIVKDIQDSSDAADQEGYYAYSGIAMFAKYLQDYLAKYEIEEGKVIHRTQRASRALVQSIQLITLPQNRLSDAIATQIYRCNGMIAEFGSTEQHELHLSNLHRHRYVDDKFFTPLITHFKELLQRLQGQEQESMVA